MGNNSKGSFQNTYSNSSLSIYNSAEKYITAYFPGSIFIAAGKVKTHTLDLTAYNNDNLFLICSFNTLSALHKRIKSDIAKLNKIKHSPANLYYFVHSTHNLLKDQNKNLSLSLSDKNYKVILFDEKSIIEQFILGHNTYDKSAEVPLFHLYHQLHNSPQIQSDVLEEIFAFVNTKDVDYSKLASFDKKLLPLKSKVRVNFTNNNYKDVIDTYNVLWTEKELVEFFIKNNFHKYHRQFYAILDKIRNQYKVLKHNLRQEIEFPVNGPIVFEDLSKHLIPPLKSSDPRYYSMAKAIILFLFEYCDFGKKSPDDPPSLFESYSGSYDNT